MKHITVKLSQCWPNIDPGCQIIRLSTTKALDAHKYGIMTEEFALLKKTLGFWLRRALKLVWNSIGGSLFGFSNGNCPRIVRVR